MITATQLRELRETLQDLIAVAPDNETGRAAVLRAHNLNNVHNLDEVTPSPAKNPMYNRFWVVKTNLTATRGTLISGTVAHTVVTEAIHALEDWFATVEGTTVTPEMFEQAKGRTWRQGQKPVQITEINFDETDNAIKNILLSRKEKFDAIKQAYNSTPAVKNPVQYTDIPAPENTVKADAAMQAINNNLLILKHLSESKIGKLRIQLKYNSAPVPNDTVVLRLSWWQRNGFQVKKLINTLSRKKFEVKQEGKYMVIWQAR